MAVKETQAEIISIEKEAAEIFKILLSVHEPDVQVEPGQFAHVSVPGCFLRRPFSIAGYDGQDGVLELVVQTAGDGTEKLTRLHGGQRLSVLFPLGRPFPMDEAFRTLKDGGELWLAAGGIGAVPLFLCAERIAAAGFHARCFTGFRDEAHVFDIKRLDRASGNGGAFRQVGGLVTEALVSAMKDRRPGLIFTCGPRPFLRAMQELCRGNGIRAFASLEEAMGCGLGACLTCSCGVYNGNPEQGHYIRVCRDGPVVNLADVIF